MSWLRQIFGRRRTYGELSDEIRAHLDEKVDELVRGGRTYGISGDLRWEALAWRVSAEGRAARGRCGGCGWCRSWCSR